MALNNVVTHLPVTICTDASEAIRQGFLYRAPVHLPIGVEKAVVVRNGTTGGNPTVDFILEDDRGQKYVFMITAKLLETVVAAANA